MNVGFIGCVETSRTALQALIKSNHVNVVCVVSQNNSTFNADCVDLTDLCVEHDIPYLMGDANSEAAKALLNKEPLDLIFCIGWSFLLKKEILSIAAKGVIGYHPAHLPQNRGRHPLIWALALGLKETASTLFLMDEGADSGEIVSQRLIGIDDDDYARDVYDKLLDVLELQVSQLCVDFAKETVTRIQQVEEDATYWRKRSRKDGLIDWRMPAEAIRNLVRALGEPYPGAEFEYRGAAIIVRRCDIDPRVFPINFEPGKVLEVKGDTVLVKCAADKAVWLSALSGAELPKLGDYL